jgi:hypothetical protein
MHSKLRLGTLQHQPAPYLVLHRPLAPNPLESIRVASFKSRIHIDFTSQPLRQSSERTQINEPVSKTLKREMCSNDSKLDTEQTEFVWSTKEGACTSTRREAFFYLDPRKSAVPTSPCTDEKIKDIFNGRKYLQMIYGGIGNERMKLSCFFPDCRLLH